MRQSPKHRAPESTVSLRPNRKASVREIASACDVDRLTVSEYVAKAEAADTGARYKRKRQPTYQYGHLALQL